MKKRFVELKSNHTISLRGERTNLKTYLTQSGKGGSEVYNTEVDSSDTVANPLRKKKSSNFRIQKWSARSTTDNSETPKVPKVPEMCLSSP